MREKIEFYAFLERLLEEPPQLAVVGRLVEVEAATVLHVLLQLHWQRETEVVQGGLRRRRRERLPPSSSS